MNNNGSRNTRNSNSTNNQKPANNQKPTNNQKPANNRKLAEFNEPAMKLKNIIVQERSNIATGINYTPGTKVVQFEITLKDGKKRYTYYSTPSLIRLIKNHIAKKKQNTILPLNLLTFLELNPNNMKTVRFPGKKTGINNNMYTNNDYNATNVKTIINGMVTRDHPYRPQAYDVPNDYAQKSPYEQEQLAITHLNKVFGKNTITFTMGAFGNQGLVQDFVTEIKINTVVDLALIKQMVNMNRSNMFPTSLKAFSRLEVLDIKYFPIKILPVWLNKLSSTLKHLTFQNCEINKIPKFTNDSILKCHHINFSINKISEINGKFNCKTINFQSNNLTTFDANAFNMCTNINLSANPLSTLENINCCTQLTSLVASACNLKSIPVLLPLSLQFLKLSYNNFGMITNTLSKNININTLNLENCSITVANIPVELVKLKILNLKNNKIETLSDSFSKLKSLQVLDLSSNMIKLPETGYDSFTTLTHLYLKKNNISKLPKQFIEHFVSHKLMKLDVTDNPIATNRTIAMQISRMQKNIQPFTFMASIPRPR